MTCPNNVLSATLAHCCTLGEISHTTLRNKPEVRAIIVCRVQHGRGQVQMFTTMITNNNDDDDDTDDIEIHKVKYVDDYDSNIGSTSDDSIKR